MEYEEMRRMEKSHVCAQCKGGLVITWDMVADCYQLVCSYDIKHQGYKLLTNINQKVARGEADQLLGPGAQNDLEKLAAQGAPALSLLPEKDIATGDLIPRDKMLALIDWATRLGLKPYLGHVCLYFGKPYVTIDGYYYKAADEGRNIRIGTRPLNSDARQSYDIPAGDLAWLAEVWQEEVKLPTTGLGIVTREEIEGKSTRKPEEFRAPVVHSHPQRMAEKRAEWQLLRKLIPLEESH